VTGNGGKLVRRQPDGCAGANHNQAIDAASRGWGKLQEGPE
jgi:hypothetical protein